MTVTSTGDAMPIWILICSNCKFEFRHSQIIDSGMSRLLLYDKPDIPVGHEFVCPTCGFSGVYQSSDLRYRH
jgi:hypothetical protein